MGYILEKWLPSFIKRNKTFASSVTISDSFLVITPSTSTEFLGRPAWFNERIRLLWDFYPTPEKFEPVNKYSPSNVFFLRFHFVKDVAIGRLSVTEQEAIIVEDLLLCMLVSIYLNRLLKIILCLFNKGYRR